MVWSMATRRRVFERIGRLYQSVWGKLLLLVVAIAILTGGAGLIVSYGFDEFDSYGEGAWWAFIHLLDPGAVREDETWATRVLGAILVVCGVVLIIGILFEVLTQVVDRSLSRLDQTTASVRHVDHIVFDGWRWSLPTVIDELARVSADPVGHVVVIAPTDLYDDRTSLRSALPRRGQPRVDLLFGDPRDPDRLARAGVERARSVAVVRDDGNVHDPMTVDLDVIKRAVVLARFLNRPRTGRPAVFYELTETRNANAAADTVPDLFDPIIDDSMVSSILKLTVLEPSWAVLIVGLLDESSGLRIRRSEAWAGRSLRSIDGESDELTVAALPAAGGVDLDPDLVLKPGDRIVTLPWDGTKHKQSTSSPVEVRGPKGRRISLAVVGWNRNASALITDLLAITDLTIEISSIAPVPERIRASDLAARGVTPDAVRFLPGPPRDVDALQRAVAEQRPDAVIVTSTVDGSEGRDAVNAADAAAVFDLMAIRQMSVAPNLVVADLINPDSAGPIGEGGGERTGSSHLSGFAPVLPVDAILARILARLLVTPELGTVLDALVVDDTRRPVELTVAAGGPASFVDARNQLWTAHQNIAGAVVDGRPVLAPSAETTIEPGCALLAFSQ